MDSDGSNVTQVTHEVAQADQPSFSPDGTRLVYTLHGPTQSDVFMINVDGTGRMSLTNTSTLSEAHPAFSPDGQSVAYDRTINGTSTSDVYLENVATKAVSPVTSDGLDSKPSWDVTKNSIWVLNSTAGWKRFTLDGGFDNTLSFVNTIPVLRGGPAANEVAYVFGGDVYANGSTFNPHKIFPGPVADLGGFSPDGLMVVLSLIPVDSQTTQIYRINVLSGVASRITEDILDSGQPAWGPAPASTILVGASTALATTASGFIYGQAGDDLTGALAFKAVTQSTVVVAAPGQQTPGPNITYTIDADDLTNISYANGTMLKPIRVVGTGGPVGDANGAIVSINASTGRIVNVLAFAGNRGPRPSITREGSDTVFKGQFMVATDKNGKDLAGGRSVQRVRLTSNGTVTVS
jgi:hypothetical protein